jgi:Flp pilus assembly protein TadG
MNRIYLPNNRRLKQTRRPRSGATIVEGAVVLALLLTLLLFTLDVGLAVLRYNGLSTAVRALARNAIVRGRLSSPEATSWGPAAAVGTAADEAYAVTLQHLATMKPADVRVEITWPDGGNSEGDRVRAKLSYMSGGHSFLSMLGAGTLRAESDMLIAQ